MYRYKCGIVAVTFRTVVIGVYNNGGYQRFKEIYCLCAHRPFSLNMGLKYFSETYHTEHSHTTEIHNMHRSVSNSQEYLIGIKALGRVDV
jgi:hypothetical protein